MVHLPQGAVRDAESDARTATELGLHVGFAVSLIALSVLIESLVEKGELEGAEGALREAGRDGEIPNRLLEN